MQQYECPIYHGIVRFRGENAGNVRTVKGCTVQLLKLSVPRETCCAHAQLGILSDLRVRQIVDRACSSDVECGSHVMTNQSSLCLH